jgi:hypothetical protein
MRHEGRWYHPQKAPLMMTIIDTEEQIETARGSGSHERRIARRDVAREGDSLQDKCSVVETVKTEFGAKAMGLDLETHNP